MGAIDVVRDRGRQPATFTHADGIGDRSVAGAWLEACLLGRTERLSRLTADNAQWHRSAHSTTHGKNNVTEHAQALLGHPASTELISLHDGGVVAVALLRQRTTNRQATLSTLFLRVENDHVAEVWVAPVGGRPTSAAE